MPLHLHFNRTLSRRLVMRSFCLCCHSRSLCSDAGGDRGRILEASSWRRLRDSGAEVAAELACKFEGSLLLRRCAGVLDATANDSNEWLVLTDTHGIETALCWKIREAGLLDNMFSRLYSQSEEEAYGASWDLREESANCSRCNHGKDVGTGKLHYDFEVQGEDWGILASDKCCQETIYRRASGNFHLSWGLHEFIGTQQSLVAFCKVEAHSCEMAQTVPLFV